MTTSTGRLTWRLTWTEGTIAAPPVGPFRVEAHAEVPTRFVVAVVDEREPRWARYPWFRYIYSDPGEPWPESDIRFARDEAHEVVQQWNRAWRQPRLYEIRDRATAGGKDRVVHDRYRTLGDALRRVEYATYGPTRTAAIRHAAIARGAAREDVVVVESMNGTDLTVWVPSEAS